MTGFKLLMIFLITVFRKALFLNVSDIYLFWIISFSKKTIFILSSYKHMFDCFIEDNIKSTLEIQCIIIVIFVPCFVYVVRFTLFTNKNYSVFSPNNI